MLYLCFCGIVGMLDLCHSEHPNDTGRGATYELMYEVCVTSIPSLRGVFIQYVENDIRYQSMINVCNGVLVCDLWPTGNT